MQQNEYLVLFTCKNRRRYSRERAPPSFILYYSILFNRVLNPEPAWPGPPAPQTAAPRAFAYYFRASQMFARFRDFNIARKLNIESNMKLNLDSRKVQCHSRKRTLVSCEHSSISGTPGSDFSWTLPAVETFSVISFSGWFRFLFLTSASSLPWGGELVPPARRFARGLPFYPTRIIDHSRARW